jgi:hypothetical protein
LEAEFWLVSYDLQSQELLFFMIEDLIYLAEGAFANYVEDFISVDYAVMCSDFWVAVFISEITEGVDSSFAYVVD